MAQELTVDRSGARPAGAAAAGVAVLLVLAAWALALAARVLPATLAGALVAALVLLVPGLALGEALAGRRGLPAGTRLALGVLLGAGALVPALGVTVLLRASIDVAVLVLVATSVGAAAVAGLRGARPPGPRDPELRALGLVAALAVPAAWLAAAAFAVRTFRSDVYYHAGRTRHLLETDAISLGGNVELVGGSPHPGYLVPLWHAYEAVVARLGALDPLEAYAGVAAGLTVVAAALGYALGRAALGSRAAGGVAAAAALAAGMLGPGIWAVPWRNLPLPGPAVVDLLFPALLAVALADRSERRPVHLLALAAGAVAATLMHPTYIPFVALVLVGALVGDLLLGRRGDVLRALGRVGILLVPFAGFALALASAIGETRDRMVSGAVAAEDIDRALRLREIGELWGLVVLDPRELIAEHPLGILALVGLPLAALARRRAAALAVGGGGAILATMVVPPLFEVLTHVLSISQSRRVALFLPLALIVAAGAAGAAGLATSRRRRALVLGCALAAGLATVLLEGAASDRRLAVPLALGALALGVLALLVRGRRGHGAAAPAPLVVLGVGLLALAPPVGREAVRALVRERPPSTVEVPPSVAAAVAALPGRPVLVSTLGVGYLLPTYADVQVYAALPKHVANTARNDPYRRAAVTERILDPRTAPALRARLLAQTRAGYLLLPPSEAAALASALAAEPARYVPVAAPAELDGFALLALR